ncbi:type II secretion system F family protein [Brevibacterium samyangense]|uniref:Type II secretion system F family protein n=1 Tax=Brevibacterium samyangense TaxID=366888 RepID=A0ABP5F4V3_9MICO
MNLFWTMAVGGIFGLGVFLLVRTFYHPKPGVGALVARLDQGRKSMRTSVLTEMEEATNRAQGVANSIFALAADRLEAFAAERGWTLGKTGKDLAIMSKSVGGFLATSVFTGLAMFLFGPLVWGITQMLGVDLPGALPFAVALVFGALGAAIPYLSLKQEAEKRRKEFRKVVGIFLDLVAMNLSGGRGLPEALLAAASVSENWALVRIRQALANARLLGISPWEGLGELGEAIHIEELTDLAGALGLAANDGAKIRSSLAARADTMRTKELSEVEGKEGERSQSMLVAQLLLSGGFLLFLAYPAIGGLMNL